ncbi:MAG: hypothetical protein ACRDPF_38945 [Streptosporangiaceae bacterium]
MVLAVSAAAIAIMDGPAFASNNPVVGNIVGDGNIPILSGNNVQIPVQVYQAPGPRGPGAFCRDYPDHALTSSPA